MWWNSETGVLYLYYNDGNTSQWVPATLPSAAQSGALCLYSEQVCVGGETQMNVTIPLNSKRVELEYTFRATSGDPNINVQTVESGVVNASVTHVVQVLNSTSTTTSSGLVSAAAAWAMGGTQNLAGYIKFWPMIGFNCWEGVAHNAMRNSAGNRYINLYGLDGGANPATTTGFRITPVSSSFVAGSFFRAFVVM